MIVLGVIMAPMVFRLIRASALAVSEELYVDAARVSGLGDARITRRHILPVVIAPSVIQATQAFAVAIGIPAGLAFLGLGKAARASWGAMLNDAFTNVHTARAAGVAGPRDGPDHPGGQHAGHRCTGRAWRRRTPNRQAAQASCPEGSCPDHRGARRPPADRLGAACRVRGEDGRRRGGPDRGTRRSPGPGGGVRLRNGPDGVLRARTAARRGRGDAYEGSVAGRCSR